MDLSKKEELIKISELVYQILSSYPQARNDDNFLFYKVCHAINRNIDKLFVSQFLLDLSVRNIYPAFETVRRTRQKIQADNPELSADRTVRRTRMRLEKEYREFAREKKENNNDTYSRRT